MNIADLEIFLAIADTENMQQAAHNCNKSPSVMSKSLKRLETQLGIRLFERIGKHIALNDQGRSFRRHAVGIVAQAKQSLIECSSLALQDRLRIAAPSLVLFRWATVMSKTLNHAYPQSGIEFVTAYEHQALKKLIHGQAEVAIVTTAMSGQIPESLHVTPLGPLKMAIGASQHHPILEKCQLKKDMYWAHAEDALNFPFIGPSISPYCGEARGTGCDGWFNDVLPRQINMVANDYGVLGQLVKSGQVLAYLPEFWIRELNLKPVGLVDGPTMSHEDILLLSHRKGLVDLFVDYSINENL